MHTLSIVVLTYNNEPIIERFVQHVTWADELIVVDSGSTDRTCEIARAIHPNCRIFVRELDSFADQRNFGNSRATGDWIMHCDSDEVVTEALRDEIRGILEESNPEYDAYNIVEHFYWRSHRIRYTDGPWGGGVKLHKRGKGVFIGDIHERFSAECAIGLTRSPIQHRSEEKLNTFLHKKTSYSEREIAAIISGKREFLFTRWNIFWKPARYFLGKTFVRGAFRDGIPGMVFVLMQSMGLFLLYVKYWDRVINKGKRIS